MEESGLPGMYREASLNSIWEGSGNVTALDVLRALRMLASLAALTETGPAAAAGGAAEYQARRLAGLIASLLQGALLRRHAPPPVADAFCASRLGSAGAGGPGYAFGTLPDGLELMPVVDRARSSEPHGS